jgi:hypothetical protein
MVPKSVIGNCGDQTLIRRADTVENLPCTSVGYLLFAVGAFV